MQIKSGKARFPHFFNVDQVKRMAFTAGEDTINRDDAVTYQIDWFVFLSADDQASGREISELDLLQAREP